MTAQAPRDHSTLGSVRNAARLLKEFSRDHRELGVTELARRLGIGKSTAHRLLATLAEERLVDQNPQTGAYRLGLAVYELGNAVSIHADLHEACAEVVDALRNATKDRPGRCPRWPPGGLRRATGEPAYPAALRPGRAPKLGPLHEYRQGAARIPVARATRARAHRVDPAGTHPAYRDLGSAAAHPVSRDRRPWLGRERQ
jgi:predicted transcriptional regulator